MKHLILALVMVFCLQHLQAQAPLRVEIEAKTTSDRYDIIPIGASGLIVFCIGNEWDDGKPLTVTKYDTDFRELWSKEVRIKKHYANNRWYLDNDQLHILLSQKSKNGHYQIYTVDVNSGSLSVTDGTFPLPVVIDNFKVINSKAFISGMTEATNGQKCARLCLLYATCGVALCFGGGRLPSHPYLVRHDLNNGSNELIPFNYSGRTAISMMTTANELAEIIVVNTPKKESPSMHLLILDENANEQDDLLVKTGNGNNLQSARIHNEGSTKVMMGTYNIPYTGPRFRFSIGSARSVRNALAANGIYFTKYVAGKQKYIKYYKFSDFPSFWENMNPEYRAYYQRVEEKAERGGTAPALAYNLLVHDIIRMGDQYVLVGEAYYPEYHTEWRCCDSDGDWYTQTVFDGYRYTHAFIASFNEDGDLLWEDSFEIWNILTYNLKERVRVLTNKEQIALVYSFGNALHHKVFEDGEVISDKTTTTIETPYTDEEIRGSYSTDLEYWYDQYMLVYGFQRIKEVDENGRRRRSTKKTIFYFQKLAYD